MARAWLDGSVTMPLWTKSPHQVAGSVAARCWEVWMEMLGECCDVTNNRYLVGVRKRVILWSPLLCR